MTEERFQSGYPSYPLIQRGSVASLSLYEVTDYELELLEQGSPASLFLNFAIFLLSVGISLAVTITTSVINNDRLFTLYSVCAVVGLVGGTLLLGLWYRTRRSMKALCAKIRGRILQDVERPGPPDAPDSTIPAGA